MVYHLPQQEFDLSQTVGGDKNLASKSQFHSTSKTCSQVFAVIKGKVLLPELIFYSRKLVIFGFYSWCSYGSRWFLTFGTGCFLASVALLLR